MLQTKRLILRNWKDADLESFTSINADARVMEFYPSTLTSAESKSLINRLKEHFKKFGFGLFAIELKLNSEFIGFVGLQNIHYETHFTPATEVGWRIAFDHWNQGYATEAAKASLEYGFSELNLDEIVAMTSEINTRSRRVMEKLGMIHHSEDDFEHPLLSEGRLKKHVLYRIQNKKLIV